MISSSLRGHQFLAAINRTSSAEGGLVPWPVPLRITHWTKSGPFSALLKLQIARVNLQRRINSK